MPSKRSFPGWAGPVVGPIVGALGGVKVANEAPEMPSALMILVGAGLGLLAGLIVWFLDARRSG